MADYVPPPGPPPPKVPAGWKAQWNDQYKEWFYVNLHTKQSQWEKPTEPVYGADGGAPPGAPPGYDHNSSRTTGPEKGSYLNTNNPYGPGAGSSHSSSHNVVDDEAYARKLQEEENARVRATADRGAADGYYGAGASSSPAPTYGQGPQYGQTAASYPQQHQPELPPRDGTRSKGGLMGKLFGKTSSSSRPQQPYGYGQPHYQQGPPPGQYGGYPQQQPYYGGGGYPQQGGYGQPPRKSGGMGVGGAAALGVGGGLLGGMLLADAMEDHDQNEYDQGYDQGYDNGQDDYGGGDDGGDF
ncbi:hypothetical protein AAFC00_005166 [Neodothiora populina]|uniref:WW domain-containing protein n=1 Tax=Neodothiora populina TaxID=2781224 RepID=A0ABR3PK04_9PEZI